MPATHPKWRFCALSTCQYCAALSESLGPIGQCPREAERRVRLRDPGSRISRVAGARHGAVRQRRESRSCGRQEPETRLATILLPNHSILRDTCEYGDSYGQQKTLDFS